MVVGAAMENGLMINNEPDDEMVVSNRELISIAPICNFLGLPFLHESNALEPAKD
jgi:hypothetical protein